MILCNGCAKHSATIYFKGIVNGQMIKLHLCESCAKKKGMVFPFAKSTFSLGDMVADLAKASKARSSVVNTFCRRCGLTYAEFQQTSQLGCGRCYETFASVLEPLLLRIHGSTQHIGKTQRRTVRLPAPPQELARLKLELQDAIRREAYEKAALLRDQIRQMEERLTRQTGEA